MIETADNVARRYGITREDQDLFSVESQRRTAAAQSAGLFDEEIVAMDVTYQVTSKETGKTSQVSGRIVKDEGNRPETTYEALAKLKPVRGEEQFITAGNASQLSDGASALVLMSDTEAKARGLTPLGIFRGYATAGCEPDEMGVGPVFAVPRLLQRNGLTIDDIDLWELNEAFASQSVHPQAWTRPRESECQRRGDRDRPPFRHVGGAPRRSCAAGRAQAARSSRWSPCAWRAACRRPLEIRN
jgi:acetyl-CoA C-acetyltransferase